MIITFDKIAKMAQRIVCSIPLLLQKVIQNKMKFQKNLTQWRNKIVLELFFYLLETNGKLVSFANNKRLNGQCEEFLSPISFQLKLTHLAPAWGMLKSFKIRHRFSVSQVCTVFFTPRSQRVNDLALENQLLWT